MSTKLIFPPGSLGPTCSSSHMIESSIFKSCGQCRQAKKKCVFSPQAIACDRCLRLGKKCVRIEKKKTVDLSVVCLTSFIPHVQPTGGISKQKGNSYQDLTSSKTPVASKPSHGVSGGNIGPAMNAWHTSAEHLASYGWIDLMKGIVVCARKVGMDGLV